VTIVLLSLFSTVFYIGNQWLSVGVTDETQVVRAGSVVYLNDNISGTQMAGQGQFSGINTGAWIPANGEITILNDSSLVFHTDHFANGVKSLPVDLTVTYTVVNRGIEMSYRFLYIENVEFWNPFEIDFYISDWDSISISNQTAIDEEFALDGSTGFQRFSGDQMFRFAGGVNPAALFVLPNTSKGIVVVNDDGINPYMSVRVLDTELPRESANGPVLHSVMGAGEIDEYFIRFSMDEYFAPMFIGGHPYGAERSSAWMLDELTFVHPGQGNIWGFSETSEGDEAVTAGLISLLEAHPLMKMDWLLLPDAILTPNRDSVWFEPGYEDSWSHWHGSWRFCTEATPEYLQWLRNIQNRVYPWADRVNMGSHGYHHTPNPDSSYGEFHEFINYEPQEHQERFSMFFSDLAACGLDTSLVRVIRFPGHRTSLSGLQAVIDHGFTFYCNGWRLIDWYAGKQFRNQWISRYQTPNGRIWGSNSVWWGDYQMMYPTEYLSEVMEKGKFGLLGCHPISMLAVWGGAYSPEAYARIDSLLTSLETDYDNFIWLFPSEYGDYLENCFNIRENSLRSEDTHLELSLTGFIPDGLTICAALNPLDQVESVLLNEEPVQWELRSGGRLFAVLPETAFGDHSVTVVFNPLGIEDGDSVLIEDGVSTSQLSICTISPCSNEQIIVNVQGIPTGETFDLRVFDISGRVIAMQTEVFNGSVHTINISSGLPAGIYYITATAQGMVASTRTVVTPR
jgi:hypothetical protein